MDEDRFPSNFGDRFGEHAPHHHHGHHGHGHRPPGVKPKRLIVFFLEAPTVPQEIDEQLDSIIYEASLLTTYAPEGYQNAAMHRVREIRKFADTIRGEVMKMADKTAIQPPAGSVTQLLLTDTVGLIAAVLEADDSGAVFFPPEGPLSFKVDDPQNTVTQGVAADGVTPTFVPNGSGNTGIVTVTATDAGNNLVGSGSFTVAAPTPPPPPPDEATQLGVFFQPNTAASSAPSGAGDAAAAAAAQVASGTATTPDPHKSK